MDTIQKLQSFLNQSHSTYHAVALLKAELEDAGYTCLSEGDSWSLKAGGKYYLIRNGSAILAFRVPEAPKGFLITASHADRPCFKVKENAVQEGAYTRLLVEKYGGALIAPWLDRPLSVAGRVLVETEKGVESRLVDVDRDLLLMPNVAIHMNRAANDGYKWNPATDTIPLLADKTATQKFWDEIETLAGGKILGHDLYLYVRQASAVWGLDNEFISAQALDDLECVWSCLQGFLQGKHTAKIPVFCVFDSEEVGSSSYQGAASDLLERTITRICDALKLDKNCQLANSFCVSADNAHALHPNHPEYADSANAPVMNGGVVIKFNANQRYTTDGLSCAIFRKICEKAGVPVQTYCNRADLPGGSTLGNISLSQVAVPSVDIGLPQLAMHSCYETAGVKDVAYLVEAMTAYYGADMEIAPEGSVSLK